jgi:hypothetical protein
MGANIDTSDKSQESGVNKSVIVRKKPEKRLKSGFTWFTLFRVYIDLIY